jgi:hypothetical protein
MRGFLPPLIILLLTSAAPADDLHPGYSHDFRRPAIDLALIDGNLWVTDGYGVTLYTPAIPPRPIGRIALPGTTSSVTGSGSTAWIRSGRDLVSASWNGHSIVVHRTIPFDQPIEHMTVSNGYLYLATSTGIVQIDPDLPDSRRTLTTSTGFAVHLFSDQKTLWAADGDRTIEVYSIEHPSLPQQIDTIETQIIGATRVYVSGDLLFVSNGRQTEVLTGPRPPSQSIGFVPFGAATFDLAAGGIGFMAGQDTTVRALDFRFSGGPPAILFEERIPPSTGPSNRISAIAAEPGRVFVAAGDAGLHAYDTSGFTAPFQVVKTPLPEAAAIATVSESLVVASSSADFPRVYRTETSGALTEQSRWENHAGARVRDASADRVLLTTGSSVRIINPSSGTLLREQSMGATVVSAVLTPNEVWAVLSNRTLRRLDLDDPQSTPVTVTIDGAEPNFIERNAERTKLAAGSIRDDGETTKTTIHLFEPSNPSAARSMTVTGAATSGAAITSGAVAIATFRGLSVLRVEEGNEIVSPLGEGIVPVDLTAVGNEIIVVGSSGIQRRRAADGALTEEIPIHSDGLAVTSTPSGSRVLIGASDATYVLDIETPSRLPVSMAAPMSSRYFTEMVVSNGVLHLLEHDLVVSVPIVSGALSNLMRSTLIEGGAVGIAAVDGGFCALDTRGVIRCFDAAARPIAATTIPAPDDASFLRIHGLGDTVWVSLLKGCPDEEGCRKRTVVARLTGGALPVIAEIEGEVVDLDGSGDRVAVVTELPRELRVYSLAGGAPSLLAGRPIDHETAAVSLDPSRQSIYLLGMRLFVFDSVSLDLTAELLDPFTPSVGMSLRNQNLLVDGSRALITGRREMPMLLEIVGPNLWIERGTILLPSVARRAAAWDDFVIILTSHSIEILGPGDAPSRRRAVRR